MLAYHTVPDSSKFEKQVKFLISNYNIIDVDTLQLAIKNKSKLPKKSLLITFDDGDISVYQNALPVLKKYNLPAVVFVITSLIGTYKGFWWNQVEKYYEYQGKTFKEARQKVNILKNISESERREYLSTIPTIEWRQLKIKELQEMSENGVSIANHTHTHPMMNNCSSYEMKEELNKVENLFRKWYFPKYEVFAYPNGNWNRQTENVIRDAGISTAFLFDHQLNSEPINPLRISRIAVATDDALPEFKVKVSGLHTSILALKKSLSFKSWI